MTARRSPTWTCQRQNAGEKCQASNPNRYRNCRVCGKPRPPRTRPAHMSALDLSYDYYVQINGGPNCGICGKPPRPGRRHHRDHDHTGVGFARGLACFRCNAAIRTYMTLDWLRKAVAYLERAEARRPR